jgi:hypothetical protein
MEQQYDHYDGQDGKANLPDFFYKFIQKQAPFDQDCRSPEAVYCDDQR